ncbi:MAG: ThuA domain-containing protein [Planctomycetaceae bacterium]|nr:ThuA domain-containing protein [Planctomycetaceae bacterium]
MSSILLTSTQVLAISTEEIQKIEQAMPEKAVVKPEAARTLLVFSLCNRFKHSCVPYWQEALDSMGQKTGAFKTVHSTDMNIFSAESLKQFDAICFNNTTKLTPNVEQQKAIMDFITGGKGIVGIHAATDNFDDWAEGAMMMGGIFKGHPWTAGGTWAIKIDEPQHPLMKAFEGKGFKVNDEIYRTLPPQYSRSSQRVLMSLDMSDEATKNAKGVTPEDADTGISWIKPVGKGRLFYCSLGHNHHLTWTKPVLEHYLAGIQYAMGDFKVDDTPATQAAGSNSANERIAQLLRQVRRYDWDQDRAPLAEFEKIVREWPASRESLEALESMVLEALHSECTLAAKDFFCRQLAVVGSEKSVPVLSKMLSDKSTFDMARLALDKIWGQQAENALLQSLQNTKDPEQKAGLVTSLGARKSNAAVDVIAALIKDENMSVGQSAIQSLGMIGTEQAGNALQAAALSDAALKARVQDALLQCAQAAVQSGRMDGTRSFYGQLYAEAATPVIQAGALVGLGKTGGPQLNEMVLNALKGNKPELLKAAATVLAMTEDKDLLEQTQALTAELSPAAQIESITALSQNPAKVGRAAAEQLVRHSRPDVRIAAFEALASLGNADSIIVLARAAANAQDRNERQAAQEALYRVADAAADKKVLAGINDEQLDEPVRIELIQAAVQRRSKGATAALLRSARSPNETVSSQSMRALQSVAGPGDINELIKLAVEKPNENMESALTAAVMKIDNRNQRAEAIIERYPQIKEPKVKALFLAVAGKSGDRNAVPLLEQEFASGQPAVSEAAFRAMTQWPGGEFTGKMKEIAKHSADNKQKVLAFRAYVRMLDTDAAALIDAYAFAERPEEQKVVIAALGQTPSQQSLAFLEKVSASSELKSEAETSILSVCEKMGKTDVTTPVLRRLAESGSNGRIKARAAELISR